MQSVQPKDAELTGMYYDYALAAPCMAGLDGSDSSGRSVMILGMGSGTFASYCTRYFPGISVKGAEIDGKIADIAHEYFSLPDSYFDSIISWQQRRNGVTKLSREHIGYENGVLGGVSSAVQALTAPGEKILAHSPRYRGISSPRASWS